jgi:hypothetical protein
MDPFPIFKILPTKADSSSHKSHIRRADTILTPRINSRLQNKLEIQKESFTPAFKRMATTPERVISLGTDSIIATSKNLDLGLKIYSESESPIDAAITQPSPLSIEELNALDFNIGLVMGEMFTGASCKSTMWVSVKKSETQVAAIAETRSAMEKIVDMERSSID